jgi:hypothetical protein
MSFTVLILVCSMSMDHAACQPDTAIDVVQGPKVDNQMMCGLFGQSMIAQTALVPREGEEYLKIMCTQSGFTRRTADLQGETE